MGVPALIGRPAVQRVGRGRSQNGRLVTADFLLKRFIITIAGSRFELIRPGAFRILSTRRKSPVIRLWCDKGFAQVT